MESSRRHPKARTVALVGRAGSGKTSLLEAMVVAGGGLHHAGRVEDGSALGGRDPEERAHQTSLGMTLAPVWVGEDKLTLVDTPGFIDFYGDVERALDVADVAMLVVSAVDGVQADTAVLWDMCRSERVPVVIVDQPARRRARGLRGHARRAREARRPGARAARAPHRARLDVQRHRRPARRRGDHLRRRDEERARYPSELADLERRVRDSLIEAIVIGDDSMTEKLPRGRGPQRWRSSSRCSAGSWSRAGSSR